LRLGWVSSATERNYTWDIPICLIWRQYRK
jgi:hypothetical protein